MFRIFWKIPTLFGIFKKNFPKFLKFSTIFRISRKKIHLHFWRPQRTPTVSTFLPFWYLSINFCYFDKSFEWKTKFFSQFPAYFKISRNFQKVFEIFRIFQKNFHNFLIFFLILKWNVGFSKKFTEFFRKNQSSFWAPPPNPHSTPTVPPTSPPPSPSPLFLAFLYFSSYFCYFHNTFE